MAKQTTATPIPPGQLQCVVVTPESTVLDEFVEFVALPLYDGEIGIARGRSAMLGRLGYGEMRIKAQGATRRFYVDGGFVEVAGNVVSVLTHQALQAEEIDAEVAADQLETARAKKADSPELMEIRDRTVAQARAQLRMAKKN